LIVTINDASVTLSEAVAAINNDGTFQAEYDYSFNTDPVDGSRSDGPGIETFARLLSSVGTTEAVIGNTGNTGGHLGGVLEVYIGGKYDEISANTVISTINNGPTVSGLFSATAIGGLDAGTGKINCRNDNVRTVTGADGKPRNEVNMVTSILGSDENAQGYMIIHLATDANGNSITTARDLVKFFDQLTVEQTRGISVSVIRPPGVDNLDRVWTLDYCGNVIEEQLCDNLYGLGLLQPTMDIDDCKNVTYYPIEFFSYGEDLRPGNAYGSVIAQGGRDASLDIRSKLQGPDMNGVGFKYVELGDPNMAMYAEFDGYSKQIVVYIHAGATAGDVKRIIETSEQTKNLFEVSLPGNGSGIVSLQDNYLRLKGGLYDIGYRGGAAMLGAADADAHRLIIESMAEGSRQYVSVRWLAGGEFAVKDEKGFTMETSYGSDMVATINGMRAAADGRALTLSSAMLKMNLVLSDYITAGDQINFAITGGGALIQMGPDVVTNQQLRIGLPSVSSAQLGGASGKLYQLRTGQVADLLTSDGSRRLADRIIQEAIMTVSQTRGRLGAIQRSTLEPQINALQDSLVAISAAEAQISNADFAEESSRLTRAQILVQAGTRTLSIANQFPQYAASLLGG
jgi:flagellin-like hook-associated protein FlgL